MFILGAIVLNEEDPLLVGSKTTKKRKLEGVRYPCDKCEFLQPAEVILENKSRINTKE